MHASFAAEVERNVVNVARERLTLKGLRGGTTSHKQLALLSEMDWLCCLSTGGAGL